MTSLIDDLRTVIIRSAKLWDSEGVVTAADQDALRSTVESRTISAEGMDEDGALEAAPEHPGYLQRELGGGRIYVPFNLAFVFPGAATAAPVIELGQRMRLGPDNPFCLSGSTTFLGRFTGIGDLDFCEYYLADPDGMAAAILAKKDLLDPPLVFAKCADKHAQPWTGLPEDLATQLAGNDPKKVMLEFFGEGPSGALPATSAVLLTTDGEDLAAHRSFAHQEAVVPGADPARSLIKPEQLGRYVSWLRGEIPRILNPDQSNYGRQAPVKALKRCLSLMLMLGATEEVEQVLDELAGTALEDVVLDVRLEDLRDLAAARPDLSETLMDRIDRLEESAVRHPLDEQTAALEAAAEIAAAMLDRVNVWFEEVS